MMYMHDYPSSSIRLSVAHDDAMTRASLRGEQRLPAPPRCPSHRAANVKASIE